MQIEECRRVRAELVAHVEAAVFAIDTAQRPKMRSQAASEQDRSDRLLEGPVEIKGDAVIAAAAAERAGWNEDGPAEAEPELLFFRLIGEPAAFERHVIEGTAGVRRKYARRGRARAGDRNVPAALHERDGQAEAEGEALRDLDAAAEIGHQLLLDQIFDLRLDVGVHRHG